MPGLPGMPTMPFWYLQADLKEKKNSIRRGYFAVLNAKRVRYVLVYLFFTS